MYENTTLNDFRETFRTKLGESRDEALKKLASFDETIKELQTLVNILPDDLPTNHVFVGSWGHPAYFNGILTMQNRTRWHEALREIGLNTEEHVYEGLVSIYGYDENRRKMIEATLYVRDDTEEFTSGCKIRPIASEEITRVSYTYEVVCDDAP